MFWPFGKKDKTPAMGDAEWVAKAGELARRIAKLPPQIGPDLYRAVSPSGAIDEAGRKQLDLEVVVFSTGLAERLIRSHFGTQVPGTLTTLLLDRVGRALTREVADELTAEKFRSRLAELHAQRSAFYGQYDRITAAKGEPDHGTLCDGFGRLVAKTYAGKNLMARAVIGTSAREIAKTMPHYLRESGLG